MSDSNQSLKIELGEDMIKELIRCLAPIVKDHFAEEELKRKNGAV